MDDGRLVCRNPRVTLIKLRQDLLDAYYAIGEPKFFDSELPKNHNVFNWNDYHYTEGFLAQSTRFFDTFAFEVLEDGDEQSDLGKKILGLLNTDKTKKLDNKSTKDKSGADDTPKDQQSGKSQPMDKLGYRSDIGKSGYKSDGGNSGGKPRYKSGGGQDRMQPGQENDGEKSD
ncbi:hypothetical protein KI688_006475 [Linnemannia hyalina]|uniref:Uncharacterized protein n=1 Tax=Linnemannia hyalina TaxID=64524 RepID=A0A9P7XL66_9FUNG|nr:hypothetical protein KI688_006475 [Linnemannia hyalina]